MILYVCVLYVVVPPIRRSVVLVSVGVFVCLLRERSALESGAGIILYVIVHIIAVST